MFSLGLTDLVSVGLLVTLGNGPADNETEGYELGMSVVPLLGQAGVGLGSLWEHSDGLTCWKDDTKETLL